jgi:hypothetical protein
MRLVRDLIYAFLYTKPHIVDVYYKQNVIPTCSNVFPRDPYMYLNPNVVDPVIAAEAAQVLFFANKFNIHGQSGSKVSNSGLQKESTSSN